MQYERSKFTIESRCFPDLQMSFITDGDPFTVRAEFDGSDRLLEIEMADNNSSWKIDEECSSSYRIS